MQGNWIVNKNNKNIPFCATGADHALEHINQSMKFSGGLVGITLNPSVRNKFILISPELAKIATEAQQMVGRSFNARTHHQSLSSSITRHQEKSIEKLTVTVRSFTNPFSEESLPFSYQGGNAAGRHNRSVQSK